MPPVLLGAAVAAAGTTIAGVIAGTIAITLGTIATYFFTSFAISAAMGLLLSGLQSKSSPASQTAFDRTRTQNIRSSMSPRRVVYGESLVGGTLVAYFPVDTTSQQTALEHYALPQGRTLRVLHAGEWVDVPVTPGGNNDVYVIKADGTVQALTRVSGTPVGNQYSVAAGVYTIGNALLVGLQVYIRYHYVITVVKRDWHWFVMALAGHELSFIGETFLNGAPVGQLDASGVATTGQFAGYVRIKKYLGSANQTADADLIAASKGQWTKNHVGNGVAYLIIALKRSVDVFPQGVPLITVYVRGKPLYDPRDGGTRWSNNPALILRDYMLADYGLACDAEQGEIDDDLVTAMANVCEERVLMGPHLRNFTANPDTDTLTLTQSDTVFGRGDGVQFATNGTLPSPLLTHTTYYLLPLRNGVNGMKISSTYANALAGVTIDITDAGSGKHIIEHADQARYVMDGTFTLDVQPMSVLQAMLTSCAGSTVYSMGAWRMFAGVYNAPSETITADWLRGPVQMQARVPRKDAFNAVRGTYVLPTKDWVQTDFPPVRNATYVEQDNGEEVYRDIELAWTTNSVRAQRIAKINLERGRQQITVSLACNLLATKISVWSTVNLSLPQFGWTPKVFRVVSWQLAENGQGVDLALVAESADAYVWFTSFSTQPDPAPDTTLPDPWDVGMPGVPSVAETLYQTSGSSGVASRVTMSWGESGDAYVDEYVPRYRLSTATQWTALPRTDGTSMDLGELAPGTYDFGVAAINGIGAQSAWATRLSCEIFGLNAPPADVSNFSVRASGGQAVVTLTRSLDLDVRIGGRLILRWSPKTSGATWNDGTLLSDEGWPGDSTAVVTALYEGTYLAKFRDSTGHYSVNEAAFVVTEALTHTYVTIAELIEQSAFVGVHTNVAAPDGILKLDGMALWDSLGYIDDLGAIDSLGGVAITGSYEFSAPLDVGSVQTVRLFPNVESSAFDTGEFWDQRSGNLDDWGDIDGAAIDDAEVTLMVRVTDGDPGGSPTWGPWHALPGPADYTCRGVDARLDFLTGNVTHNRGVSVLSLAAKQ